MRVGNAIQVDVNSPSISKPVVQMCDWPHDIEMQKSYTGGSKKGNVGRWQQYEDGHSLRIVRVDIAISFLRISKSVGTKREESTSQMQSATPDHLR